MIGYLLFPWLKGLECTWIEVPGNINYYWLYPVIGWWAAESFCIDTAIILVTCPFGFQLAVMSLPQIFC